MGVPGLKSWVIKNCPTSRVDFRNSPCNYIAVDAVGFVYFSYTFDWLYGGQYAAFEKQVTKYLNALKCVEISPVFFFDGNSDPRKHETFIDRFCQREKESKEISKAIKNKRMSNLSYKFLPCCLISHLRTILLKNDVKIHQAEFEADVEIARFCKINAETCFGVWTNDSDMLVYDGIENVVFFEDIQLVVDDKTICCRYYNQKKVLANLGIPKYALSTLASLAGNDYMKSTEQIHVAVSKFVGRKINDSTSKTTRISLFCNFLQRNLPQKNGSELDTRVSLITKSPMNRFYDTRSHYTLHDDDPSNSTTVRISLYSDLFEFHVHDILLPLRHCYFKSEFKNMRVEEFYFNNSKLASRIITDNASSFNMLQYHEENCNIVTTAIKILKTLAATANVYIFDWEWDVFLDDNNNADVNLYHADDHLFRFRSLYLMLQLGVYYCHSIIRKQYIIEHFDYKKFDGIKYYKRYEIAYRLNNKEAHIVLK
uniref:Asteroid domain-containing protein n=1 Tax=Aplanochytrium stocchinoi TaxID=215587 RepID=A0A7S3LR81_9STRA|mmetsp:Transcript_5804/g.6869  ORF Transcript_5804/g.6869 Transcript_5804/m.6869 type:complete len:483 (+) Transcript_5804:162-1610(+)